MKPDAAASAEERFWAVAGPVLDRPGVTRSTMMGLPCLRRAARSSPPTTGAQATSSSSSPRLGSSISSAPGERTRSPGGAGPRVGGRPGKPITDLEVPLLDEALHYSTTIASSTTNVTAAP